MSDFKRYIQNSLTAMSGLYSTPYPSLGIDLDGCVDAYPIFFSLLSTCWPGRIYVVTFREDRLKAISDLQRFQVRFDELILVDSFEAKAEVIETHGIMIYFDDQPEMLKNMPSNVNVMLVRNGGNFCFNEKLWLLSERTGRLV